MATWVVENQKKIDDYFSSINSMTLRIIEERQKVQENHRDCWHDLSVKQQEERFNDWIIAPASNHYDGQSHDSKDAEDIELFPVMKVNTGQKIVELPTMGNHVENTTSWRDEHSDPFACETRSQMEMTLPSGGNRSCVRKKSVPTVSSTKDVTSSTLLWDSAFLNDDDLTITRYDLDEGFSSFERVPKTKSGAEKMHNAQMNVYKNEVENTKEVVKDSKRSVTVIADLDAGVSKSGIFDFRMERENADLASAPDTKSKKKKASPDQNKANGSQVKGGIKIKKTKKLPGSDSHDVDLSHMSKQQPNSGNTRPVKKVPPPGKNVNVTAVSRSEIPTPIIPSKKDQRKSSSSSRSSSRINPRGSLTLDGAIHNLELAMRQNSQQQQFGTSTSSETNLKDEEPKSQLSTESDLENVFGDTLDQEGSPLLDPTEVEVFATDVHKSGFDFLDDW